MALARCLLPGYYHDMKIHTNTGGLAATNAYLIADETTGDAAIIDAPQNTVASLLNVVRHHNWNVRYLLLTHGHWDHISDHKVVTDQFPDAKVLIHVLDEPKLIKPGSLIFPLPYKIPPRKADGYLEDGKAIRIGSLEFQIIFTPGHSPGHVVLYCPAESLLLAGDLLFAGAIGRTDLPDSSSADMQKSLLRIITLPDHTAVRPGHGPATTIGEEKRTNPFLLQLT
jgi:glyoxylase-like metal-dependent hydrolase (beta-lactamase superfamily II)